MARELFRRMVCAAGLPEDVMLGMPRMVLCGGRRMLMENHQGIVEYGPERLRVKTAAGVVIVEGEDLTLASLGETDLMVTGEIRRIEL
ncbi:MAG: YabP/YqfC family sporulation protein [Clostridiales bacterium]|nr:YabP/YqfC family sporulation protein [Clostridiales bacterium]MDY2835948.1 YabP/YqfC family sporulation protein [Candidatus Aphodomonas sp.]